MLILKFVLFLFNNIKNSNESTFFILDIKSFNLK